MENLVKKLHLNDIRVESFVTSLSNDLVDTIKGGGASRNSECGTCGRDCPPPTSDC
jgi:hypothetical protein